MGKTVKIPAVLLALLIVSINGHAKVSSYPQEEQGWSENGEPIPDSDNIKSRNGFGAQLWVINDEKFFEDWTKPETPHLPITKRAHRNKVVFVIILFINPGVDEDVQADVVMDVKITGPDGSIYGDFKDVEVWQGSDKVPANHIQLAAGHLGLKIEDTDQLGQYTIEAVVKDRIKNVSLPLRTELIAEE